MAERRFESTVDALFKGMSGLVSSRTVVGEPIKVDTDTVIVPLMDVSFGIGAGAGSEASKNGGAAGGIGGKMTPTSVLVISNGTTKLVSMKSQDGLSKILDMVPDFMNKFTGKKGGKETVDADAETTEE